MENTFLEEEAKKIQAEYHRNWRKKNPDKAKEITRRYWIKKAQKLQQQKEKEE